MYPVMLDVTGRMCLVVGGGGVALRKVQGLIEDGADVTVVALDVVDQLTTLAAAGKIALERRRYRSDDVTGAALVFAATDDAQVNHQVAQDARRVGAWVNVADDPEASTFHLPARVRRGPLQLALGSRGEAPFVIRRLRQVFEHRLGPEWAEWLEAAARYREAVRSTGLDRPAREDRYDRFFDGTVDAAALRVRVPTPDEERGWLEGPAPDHRTPIRAASPCCASSANGAGFVSLVGAGPGCAGLLTVRGRQRLASADAVVYDRLAATALPPDLGPEVELHPVGKTAGNHPMPQSEINALLVRLAREGRRVVRLKGGDPFVFGRGSEEAEELVAAGVPFEVVPGVTSGVAALAWAGIPVTHRRESVRLDLLTAHEAIKSDGPQVRWDLLAADPHATLVGYMGVNALPAVVEQLLTAGMPPDTPAAMVEQGTTAAQRVVVATVERLPDAVRDAGLGPPALFVIGPTVRHAERLDWFGRLPLAGERLLLPAGAARFAASLEGCGADTVSMPLPVTPATRVVMRAMSITGCVVAGRADVDCLDEEWETADWGPNAVAWCVGDDACERAVAYGWREVRHLPEGTTDAELVEHIAAARRT
jgi:uroporphyrin-III C-methyltransferase/precorrin-2 dehydrogenase/sirohydrochlorin ferrochelatase